MSKNKITVLVSIICCEVSLVAQDLLTDIYSPPYLSTCSNPDRERAKTWPLCLRDHITNQIYRELYLNFDINLRPLKMKSDRSVRKTNLRRSAEQSKRRIQAGDAMKDNSPRSLSSFSFVPVISSSASFDLSTDEALVVRKVGGIELAL